MFIRRSRLSKEEIALVSRTGQSLHTPIFSLKVLPFPQETLGNKPKFAFVMSKKEERTAVKRNLAKRRLRAAMRELEPGIKPLFCMVFIKKAAIKTPMPELRALLRESLRKWGSLAA
jgi:ribonuclease P protein component